ncbi:PEP-CTERM system TPR-repeat protein PrsT [Paucibacter sediminis]|uniref:PEP-CTERM system TPR-repeat protein PrsT n=1 Tax=Paucibacter sediminis TaxID=3019553 RepID=A0AA95SNK4_9BURK|nr:XrtA/PEP-CTERM system TPR-repeat protein PrsT [Paucibacter sp. S2-9]WIT11360.1 PEP-CTERM system TPR-repeat protein PrsT [Paucibacter sp. S2-9]
MNKSQRMQGRRAAGFIAPWVLAVSASLIAACSGDSPEQLVIAAKANIAKHDNKAAVIQLKSALQRNGSLAEARFLLGKALLESGDVSGAMIELNKALELGYDSNELTPVLAAAMVLRGEGAKLIAQYGATDLANAKSTAELKAALASAHAVAGNLDLARKSAEQALKLDPENQGALLMQVRLLTISKDFDAALKVIDKAVGANPKSAAVWLVKGDLLRAMRRSPEEQLAVFREAVNVDPGNVGAHVAVITVLSQQKDFEGAARQLKLLQAQQPGHPQTRYYAALLALESKDLKEANEQIQALLKIAPNSASALQLAGEIDIRRGAYLQATASLHKALPLTKAPAASVRIPLAQAYLGSKDPAKALSVLKPLLDTSNPPAQAHSLAADAYTSLGNTKLAQESYRRAVATNPNDMAARTMLALAQIHGGQAAQGFGDLQAISSTDPGVAAELALFKAYLSKGEFDKARQAVDSLERKKPTDPLSADLRGWLELLKGNRDKARDAFELAMKRAAGDITAAMMLGRLDLQDGKPEPALRRFERVLQADPKAVDARMSIIVLRAQAGASADEQQRLILEAIKLHPSEPAPRIAQINALLEAGQPRDAVVAAQAAIQAVPDNASLIDLLGRSQMLAGDATAASQAYGQLAKLQPNSALAAIRQAELHATLKDTRSAISQLRRALEIVPDNLDVQSALVGLLAVDGKSGEARSIIASMQAKQPQNAAVWDVGGDLESYLRNFPAAVAAFQTSLKKHDSAETAIKLHRVLLSSGKRDEARNFEEAFLARWTKDSTFLSYLGDAALGAGDYEQAVRRYVQVIKLQPDHVAALNNLGWALQKAGKPGALDYVERALKIKPDSADILDTHASILASEKRFDAAIESQKRAVALAPAQHQLRLHLAQYYLATGKKEQARTELSKLLEAGDQFGQQDEVKKLLGSM